MAHGAVLVAVGEAPVGKKFRLEVDGVRRLASKRGIPPGRQQRVGRRGVIPKDALAPPFRQLGPVDERQKREVLCKCARKVVRADAGAQLAAREDGHARCVWIRPSVSRNAECVIECAASTPEFVCERIGGWLREGLGLCFLRHAPAVRDVLRGNYLNKRRIELEEMPAPDILHTVRVLT